MNNKKRPGLGKKEKTIFNSSQMPYFKVNAIPTNLTSSSQLGSLQKGNYLAEQKSYLICLLSSKGLFIHVHDISSG
jgi:hypothetical protein